ncbi:MAG: S-layer homology domain-containing protein, partial [Clostridia bacterium]|nr:S-layer homology domain-containing protein [Clostridia bacterium]
MKKVLIAVSAVLSLVMLTPLAAFAAKNGGDGFSDVDSAKWYYDDVSKVCSSNLMKGVSATKFDPEGTLTRGMCATILYRAAKEPAVKAKATFTDVEAGAYYADAVAWAQIEGVVNGKTATEFDPDGDITREEFATMLYRYTDAEDLTLPETRDGEPVDADEVSDYAADAVDNMYKGEVVNGRENGEFDPDDDITRAETAAMMNRFLERVTVRWTTFYRTLNETWDYDAWVTFDQDAEGGFYKDVGLFDLNIGYVPEGFVSH